MGCAGAAFGIGAKAASIVDALALAPKPSIRQGERKAVNGPTIGREHPRGRHGAPWRRTTNSRQPGSVAPHKRAESLARWDFLHRRRRKA